MAVLSDHVTFDDARRMLLRGGEPLHVSLKALQLLGILIGRRPTAVSKSDLQDELLPA